MMNGESQRPANSRSSSLSRLWLWSDRICSMSFPYSRWLCSVSVRKGKTRIIRRLPWARQCRRAKCKSAMVFPTPVGAVSVKRPEGISPASPQRWKTSSRIRLSALSEPEPLRSSSMRSYSLLSSALGSSAAPSSAERPEDAV